MRISVSKMRTFRSCRAQYNYKYNKRLTKEKGKSNALVFGSAYHEALSVWYNPQNWDKKDFKGDRSLAISTFKTYLKREIDEDYRYDIYGVDQLPILLELGVGMLEWYFDNVDFTGIIPLETEINFEVEILDGVTLIGIIDLIYEKDGVIHVKDHKTAAKNDHVNNDMLLLDEQAEMYHLAAKLLGYDAKTFKYASHVKAIPKAPELLKRPYNGRKVSTARNSDVDFDLALKTIMQHDLSGFANGAYTEFLEYLKENKKEYLKEETITPNFQSVNIVLERYAQIVEDINTTELYYMNPGYNCTYCPFKSICVEVVTGGDPDTIEQLEFTVREQHE